MLTTTTDNSLTTLEKDSVYTAQSEQLATAIRQESRSFKLDLKKLYLYASVLGLVLVVCLLAVAVKNNDVLMLECLKALFIAGSLNLIRAFSIS